MYFNKYRNISLAALLAALAALVILMAFPDAALAQRRGGGGRGGGGSRGGGGGGRSAGVSRPSPSRQPSTATRGNVSTSRRDINAGDQRVSAGTKDLSGRGTQDINRDREVNRDINRDVNVDIDQDWDSWDDDWGEGFVAGAVVGGVVGAAVSSEPTYVYTLPPSCGTVVVNGVAYQNCGGAYYLPSYQGTTVVYEEVAPP